jgi:hypothetical protein
MVPFYRYHWYHWYHVWQYVWPYHGTRVPFWYHGTDWYGTNMVLQYTCVPNGTYLVFNIAILAILNTGVCFLYVCCTTAHIIMVCYGIHGYEYHGNMAIWPYCTTIPLAWTDFLLNEHCTGCTGCSICPCAVPLFGAVFRCDPVTVMSQNVKATDTCDG